MKHYFLFTLLILCFSWGTLFAEPTAKELVEKADNFRGFLRQSFSFRLILVSHQQKKKTRKNKLEVKVKNGKSLVSFLAPARDKGKAILSEGRNMWFHIPKTRRVIRISPAQRLLGQASNGDVAGANFSDDYTPTLLGEETVENTPCYKLLLKAIDRKVAYDKIEYWVDKKSGKPVKSKHYAASGKLLKEALYKTYKKFNGKEKLEKLLLVDPLFKGKYTWMIYSEYEPKTIPDTLFRKENLNRL